MALESLVAEVQLANLAKLGSHQVEEEAAMVVPLNQEKQQEVQSVVVSNL